MSVTRSLAIALACLADVQASYDLIAGYAPGSTVTDHNAIDRDQQAMEEFLTTNPPDYTGALAVFTSGGSSQSGATFTLSAALGAAVASGTTITGTAVDGTTLTCNSRGAKTATDTEIFCRYTVSDSQATYNTCRQGSLGTTTMALTTGCFTTGTITIATSPQITATVTAVSNAATRTLRGFSANAGARMLSCSIGCPYKDFLHFYNYYGDSDYGLKWVEAAINGVATGFTSGRGNADFTGLAAVMREEAAVKGSAYIVANMYAIREFEDAIDDCITSCVGVACNAISGSSVHAWDEGVAFYTGSLEGQGGSTSGVMGYRLAEKRCANFKTCGGSSPTDALVATTAATAGTATSGVSNVNIRLFDLFAEGEHLLIMGRCSEVRPFVEKIADIMSVPLIQGTLRYAWRMEYEAAAGDKERAEGATFAAAVLPRVYQCSVADAEIINTHMNMNAVKAATDFSVVKAAFERNYACMNVTCADVGGYYSSNIADYYSEAAPCVDKSTSSSSSDISSTAAAIIAIAGAAAGLLLLFVFMLISKEKAGKPIFYSMQVKPSS